MIVGRGDVGIDREDRARRRRRHGRVIAEHDIVQVEGRAARVGAAAGNPAKPTDQVCEVLSAQIDRVGLPGVCEADQVCVRNFQK